MKLDNNLFATVAIDENKCHMIYKLKCYENRKNSVNETLSEVF